MGSLEIESGLGEHHSLVGRDLELGVDVVWAEHVVAQVRLAAILVVSSTLLPVTTASRWIVACRPCRKP